MEKIRRRGIECDDLKSELNQQTEEYRSLQLKYRESQSTCMTLENAQLPKEFELVKSLREKENLMYQVSFLEQEQKQQNMDWNIQRQSFCNKISDLESQLTAESTELKSKTQQNLSLQVCVIIHILCNSYNVNCMCL